MEATFLLSTLYSNSLSLYFLFSLFVAFTFERSSLGLLSEEKEEKEEGERGGESKKEQGRKIKSELRGSTQAGRGDIF